MLQEAIRVKGGLMDWNLRLLLGGFNETFTFFLVFPGMVLLGIYLTIRLRVVQISKLKLGFANLLRNKQNCEGNISHFEAISTVLAGNFGTGNISGMAVAISTGGPGALVWMWVMSFLGAAIQYASCVLGVKYRAKNEEGVYVGGPMYYLSHGLGYRKCAAAFAMLTMLASITVGNFAQVNSMALPLQKIGINPLISGIVIAICAGIVIIGGIARLAKVASLLVPIKAILYLGFASVIIYMNAEQVIPAFKIMLLAAIDPNAVAGGVLGIGVLKVISTGFDRGIFATDAGTGIVPILQASARTSHPVIDGVVTLVAPFCVMVVCTITGLIILITGAWQVPELQSTNIVTHAFQEGIGHQSGAWVVILALVLFGYTTVLAWSCCAERAAEYLWGVKNTYWIKYVYIGLIPLGALLHVELVWILADICISLMLFVNMIGIAKLSREVVVSSREFFGEGDSETLIDSVV